MRLSSSTKRRVVLVLAAIGIAGLLSNCSKEDPAVPQAEQEALGVTGAIARYHHLLEQPYGQSLTNIGFLIGVEKIPRDAAAFLSPSPDVDAADGYDTTRLLPPTATSDAISDSDIAAQVNRFEQITDDGKVMVVSHLVEYRVNDTATRIAPELLYATYSQTAFGAENRACGTSTLRQAYAGGWDALNCLEDQVDRALSNAKQSRRPFSHIFLLSMGWNNDQLESIERYNSLIAQTAKAARLSENQTDVSFNPLVIGFTWPSVWGGTSAFDLMNRALHIGSYPAKTDDADEVGFGIANHVLNAMLPRLEQKHQIETIAIGHSMGARLLTRAYYSGHMLRGRVMRPAGTEPLLIGLQPAFSANRYRADLFPWVTLGSVIPREGGPYQDSRHNVVLTWSEDDSANPVARFLTGAPHLGGRPGFDRAEEINKILSEESGDRRDERFRMLAWPPDPMKRTNDCFPDEKILLLDATQIIRDHGDIQNANVGELVWHMINCR